MGVADRYEQDNYERWRKLPLRERYRWRVIATVAAIIAVFIVFNLLAHEADVQCELSGGKMVLTQGKIDDARYVCTPREASK